MEDQKVELEIVVAIVMKASLEYYVMNLKIALMARITNHVSMEA
jgi:hypothetical protein